MFRRFFRIGFGGCGCALEEHFRDHAAELSHDLLNDFYLKKLENWTNKLPSEPFETTKVGDIKNLIIPPPKEGEEGGNYAGKFFENLNNIIAELDSWKGSLGGAKDTVMSYEGAIIDELIQNVMKMKDEAKSIKNRGSVLLQSLPVDSFTKIEAEKYKRFYTYNQNITETRELIVDQFGHAVIESQGFNHQPELQMLPFSIKEVRDEVFKKIREYITNEKLSTLTSQGYFFYVGLGGGTGTGVISPLAEKFGKGSYGYFALAVLGAEEDNDRMKSQQPWFRRCFNMLIALNDLIVTAELDGLILVDNARLIQAVDHEELKLVFCWEEVPGDEDEKRKLIRFLRDDLKLTWAEKATIRKTADSNTITITKTKGEDSATKGEYSAKIVISDEDMTKANVISAEKTEEVLNVRIVDGKRNIYAGKLKKASPLMTDVDEKLIKALYPAFGITTLENGDYDLDWSQLRKPIGLHGLKNKPPLIVPCYASGPCWDFLFSWEKVPVEDNEKLIRFLRDDLKLTWVENATIRKTMDNNTITIVNGNDSAEMVISDDKTKATVKIDDKSKDLKVRNLKVRAEDGKLNIYKSTITDLINAALSDGMLTPCEYKTNKPEKVFVYVRCITDEEEVRDALADVFEKEEDIAILKDYLFCLDDVVEQKNYKELEGFLKNFYDTNFNLADYKLEKEKIDKEIDKDKLVFCKEGSDKCVTVQIGTHLFDWRDGKIENYEELKEYLKKKKILWADPRFLDNKISIGEGGTKAEITLDDKKEKATLSWGKGGSKEKHDLAVKEEGDKRMIYEPNVVEITITGKQEMELPLLGVKKWNDKRYLYLKGSKPSIDWVKKNLEKRIVVFESQEIGSFWHEREKKNEVLILLVNPDVKDALKERFEEAKKFVDLLVTFTDLLEASTEDKLTTANQIVDAGGDIEKVSLKRDDKELVKKWNLLEKQLNKISNVGIDEKTEKDKDKKKLKEARDFLLPEELYGKDTNIYEYMKGVLERLGEQAKFLDGYIDGTRKWPIFKEKGNIFNIISTSGKRDEVILSAIEALDKTTQNKFNSLVGKGVYDTYFQRFKRQYFKYDSRYLYRPGVGEPILSYAAEQQLPDALKKDLDKETNKRIEGDELRGLVNKHTSVMSGHAGTTDGTEPELSYPAMLAVAGLYAEWEQVGSWKFESNNFVLDGSNDKIIELFEKNGALKPDDFEDYVFSKESTKTTIPDEGNLLIIDTDKEDATLVIREADKDLLSGLTEEEVPSTKKGIPQELENKFKKKSIEDVNNDKYKVTDRKLEPIPEAKINNKLYRCYYIRQNAGTYSIDGDKSLNEQLKVKKEEGKDGKTLKIYKKRG